jgi:hypothetical protein
MSETIPLNQHFRQHWFFDIVQVAATLLAVYWIWTARFPPPGYAIGILAVLAAIMSLHADMQKWQKAAWVVLMGVYLFTEFRAITKDRNEFAHTEERRRNEQNQQFQDIASGLQSSMEQSQAQFRDTMSGIGRTINSVTGGNGFCYAMASPVGNQFLLIISTTSPDALRDINAEMTDDDVVRNTRVFTWDAIQGFTTHFPVVLSLSSSAGWNIGTIPIGTSEKRKLHFNFFAMNGNWHETLNLRFVAGHWAQAIRVTKDIRGSKSNAQKKLYEWVPPDYPKVEGKVDW